MIQLMGVNYSVAPANGVLSVFFISLFRYGGVGNNGDSIVSTVTIARAQEHHSGNYTCRPSNAEPDTITVHVLNGELAVKHVSE